MKAIMKGFQLAAIAIGIGSVCSMFYHGSLIPLLFVAAAYVIYWGASIELREIESK